MLPGRIRCAGAALKDADALADSAPATKARILFSLATLKKRQHKLDDAKAAWQRYAEHAKKNPPAFLATATARLAALDEATKQDKAYAAVRQRLAEAKHGDAVEKASDAGTPTRRAPPGRRMRRMPFVRASLAPRHLRGVICRARCRARRGRRLLA